MIQTRLFVRSLSLVTATSRHIPQNRPNSHALGGRHVARLFATDGKKKAPGTSQLKAPLLFGIGLMTGLLIFDQDFGPGAETLDKTEEQK